MNTIIECAMGVTKPAEAIPTDGAIAYGCEACEYIHNNQIHKCSKFVYLAGKNPNGEDDFVNEGKCADAWTPILQIENANTNRGQTAALESFRNETVKGQEVFNAIISEQLQLGSH